MSSSLSDGNKDDVAFIKPVEPDELIIHYRNDTYFHGILSKIDKPSGVDEIKFNTESIEYLNKILSNDNQQKISFYLSRGDKTDLNYYTELWVGPIPTSYLLLGPCLLALIIFRRNSSFKNDSKTKL